MTRITGHNLARIIDQVIGHRATGDVPILNGVHIDATATHLHAVATDRYTFAVARAKALAPADKHQADTWTRTIPAASIKALRRLIKGEDPTTVFTLTPNDDSGVLSLTVATDTISLTAPNTDGSFPAWRTLIAGSLAKEKTNNVVGLDTRFAARWENSEPMLRTWHTGAVGPVVFSGTDFIGLQMPVRTKDETFTRETVVAEWASTLDGVTPADPAELTEATAEETKNSRDFDEFLLRRVVVCTSDVLSADPVSSPAFYRTIDASNSAWSAYRLLEAFRKVDPAFADKTLRLLHEELEGGEYSEWAWEYAQNLGHDPEKWVNSHREWRTNLEARNAAEQTPEAPAAT